MTGERLTVYFNRERPGARGRLCEILERIEGGRRYRVRLVRPRKGERRTRTISALWFERPQPA